MRWGSTGTAQAAGEPHTSSVESGGSVLGPRAGWVGRGWQRAGDSYRTKVEGKGNPERIHRIKGRGEGADTAAGG